MDKAIGEIASDSVKTPPMGRALIVAYRHAERFSVEGNVIPARHEKIELPDHLLQMGRHTVIVPQSLKDKFVIDEQKANVYIDLENDRRN